MSAKILIEVLCDHIHYKRIEHIPETLEDMRITVKEARELLSTENPPHRSSRYADKLLAEIALLHADIIANANARCQRS